MKNKELIQKFWSTLFNEDEHTCIAKNVKGNQVVPVSTFTNPDYPDYVNFQYYSINSHFPGSTRGKSSVASYRNFLVEFDEDSAGNKISKKDQVAAMKASGLPWSTCTWSGSKSLHFIVALEEPLEDLRLYTYVAKWIHRIVSLSDPSTIDPARFSRVPGGTNIDKTSEKGLPPAEQVLVAVKGRVPNKAFEEWLYAHPDQEPEATHLASTYRGTSRIKKASNLISLADAAVYCDSKWPLESGSKNSIEHNHLFSWACYLVKFTKADDRDAMAKVMHDYDMGCHKNWREYERAISDALAMLESNQ
jgi:hypothetical protein